MTTPDCKFCGEEMDHLDSVKFDSFESGYPVDVTLYACPECGARVEVDHLRDDLESWLSGDGEEW